MEIDNIEMLKSINKKKTTMLKGHGFHEIIYYLHKIVHVLRDDQSKVLKELREIGQLIDAYVSYHGSHSLRVSEYALAIAKELRFNKKELTMIEAAALLHDIGKVGFNEKITIKPQNYVKPEKTEIEKQIMIGNVILTVFTDNSQILDGVRSHYEFWDGSGYPYGLRGNRIPLIGRILAVAEAYEAMTCYQPNRSVHSKDKAIAELKKFAGIRFDARIVKVFKKIMAN